MNCVVVVVTAALAFTGWQIFGPATSGTKLTGTVQSVKALTVTAVGDSLTHGVGDATDSGGYVALLKTDLEASGDYTVTTHNYGVTGNTAPQIQKRLDTDKELQTDLGKADIITLTVGGNDLMAVLRKHFFNITTKDVTAGINKFQTNLTKLVTTIRQDNPTAPIYVFGIYNPFYVYFPTLTAMTDSVTRWNQATQATLAKQTKTYYVDIDKVLSEGGTQDTSKKTKKRLEEAANGDENANPLIFTQDHFHPNNAGYAAMTRKLWAKVEATRSTWEK